MSQITRGSTRWFYTGNQTGFLNHVGLMNFAAGGPKGSGIHAGTTIPIFFPPPTNRALWENDDAKLSQELLDACYPFIELNWVADIFLGDEIFRVSDKNLYVEDADGIPRFYEARVAKAPTISLTGGEWLNPTFERGEVKLTLNNCDGVFNPYLPQGAKASSWISTPVVIRLGFGVKKENYYLVYSGFVSDKQGLESDDESVSLKLVDTLQNDNIPVPPNVISDVDNPSIEEGSAGQAIPLVYGDWTISVDKGGRIRGYCLNAADEEAQSFTFKFADNSLDQITEVWLHRGARKQGEPEGPIRLDLTKLSLDLEKAEVTIPANQIVLTEYYTLFDGGKCGIGSNDRTILSDSADTIFTGKNISAGDLLVVKNGGAIYTIVDVSSYQFTVGGTPSAIPVAGITWHDKVDAVETYVNGTIHLVIPEQPEWSEFICSDPHGLVVGQQITIDGVYPVGWNGKFTVDRVISDYKFGILGSDNGSYVSGGSIFTAFFHDGDEFSVITNRYHFIKDDVVTIKCKGKRLELLSANRLDDAKLLNAHPEGLSVDLDGNYWIADNTARKIYCISLHNEIVLELPFADIAAEIQWISGLAIQTDGTLWLFDSEQSRVYRYLIEQQRVGMNFATAEVTGLDRALSGATGITIDSGNMIYLVENATGTYFVINPFSPIQPQLVRSWNRSLFDAATTETLDIDADSNKGHLLVVDRNTQKFYRLNKDTGALVSTMALSAIAPNATFVSGVSIMQDGTVMFLNRVDNTLYNYNEFADCSNNPGFIARDLIQSQRGKVATDFDLKWNQTCRERLSSYKGRLYLQERVNLLDGLHKFLRQYNTQLFTRFGLLSIMQITFSEFRKDGLVIRDGDIREGSFKASRDYSQYFNSTYCEYNKRPVFDEETVRSDNYISVSGIAVAGKEIQRKLEFPDLYRRQDVDRLMPLFVRLSATDPEMIEAELGFRFLFTQIMDFVQINYSQFEDIKTGEKRGGRRFSMVPAFTRRADLNLDTMTIRAKLWSLGSTKFGEFIPEGEAGGGETDQVVLTTLGTEGRISPVGEIVGSSSNSVVLASVAGQSAQDRYYSAVGLAWAPGYKVALVRGDTFEVAKILTVKRSIIATIEFEEDLELVVENTQRNAAGIIVGGHFLQYASYEHASALQKKSFAYFGAPSTSYPANANTEITEQRAGAHNFPDGRQPYLLFPEEYTPA